MYASTEEFNVSYIHEIGYIFLQLKDLPSNNASNSYYKVKDNSVKVLTKQELKVVDNDKEEIT